MSTEILVTLSVLKEKHHPFLVVHDAILGGVQEVSVRRFEHMLRGKCNRSSRQRASFGNNASAVFQIGLVSMAYGVLLLIPQGNVERITLRVLRIGRFRSLKVCETKDLRQNVVDFNQENHIRDVRLRHETAAATARLAMFEHKFQRFLKLVL